MSQQFATAINCMDGRVQEPVIDWMKKEYDVPYIDMLTLPGPDKVLAEQPPSAVPGLQEKINISTDQHGSEVLALAGHADCAGNPVSADEHKKHVKEAVQQLTDTQKEGLTIIGLWIDDQWEVERIV